MISQIKSFIKGLLILCKGFGANRPVGVFIRNFGDLPDNCDSVPERLEFKPENGSCPICGESLYEDHVDVVLCRDCFAPHHKLCFEWNGKCAQYACGSKSVFDSGIIREISKDEALLTNVEATAI